MGGILRDNLGEGNCESKIAARQWGVNFRREASRCLAGALWVVSGSRKRGVEFKGGGVAVTTETAITAKTVTVASLSCIL